MAAPFAQTTRALANDSPRLAHVALGIAALVLGAWLGWFFLAQVTVYAVSRQARIESAGTPRDVTVLQAGRLSRSDLALGREVHAGDVLVELDASRDAISADEARARLQAYPGQTEALGRQIDALQAAMAEDDRAAAAAAQAAQARVREAAADADFAADNARRQQDQAAAGGVAQIDAARAA